jgi:hypothetical protein
MPVINSTVITIFQGQLPISDIASMHVSRSSGLTVLLLQLAGRLTQAKRCGLTLLLLSLLARMSWTLPNNVRIGKVTVKCFFFAQNVASTVIWHLPTVYIYSNTLTELNIKYILCFIFL